MRIVPFWMSQTAKTNSYKNPYNVHVKNFGVVIRPADKGTIYRGTDKVPHAPELRGHMICRGAWPDSRGLGDLQRFGVRTVVNLAARADDKRLPTERARAQAMGMRFASRYMDDHKYPDGVLIRSMVTGVLADPAGAPYFVHCEGGRHRTGDTIAAFSIIVDAWSNEAAVGEALRYGIFEWRHPGAIDFIRTLTR